jgi:hypothetical protein
MLMSLCFAPVTASQTPGNVTATEGESGYHDGNARTSLGNSRCVRSIS